jgi:hypothetical protein
MISCAAGFMMPSQADRRKGPPAAAAKDEEFVNLIGDLSDEAEQSH